MPTSAVKSRVAAIAMAVALVFTLPQSQAAAAHVGQRLDIGGTIIRIIALAIQGTSAAAGDSIVDQCLPVMLKAKLRNGTKCVAVTKDTSPSGAPKWDRYEIEMQFLEAWGAAAGRGKIVGRLASEHFCDFFGVCELPEGHKVFDIAVQVIPARDDVGTSAAPGKPTTTTPGRPDCSVLIC